MVQIGLVGCAHIHTPGFVRMLKERNDIRVKMVWDHDADRARQNAAELGAAVAAETVKIWQDEQIENVLICSETDRHQALVLAAAAAGKHLFVEKPLGLGAADAARMADAIEAAGLRFQTGYFMRGRGRVRFLRQAIREGHFGRITRMRLSNTHAGALQDWFTPEWLWMTDPAAAGAGAFGDLGTHVLDLLLWLAPSEVRAVTAATGTAIARYGPGCDEYGEGLLVFEDGMLAVLAAGWVDVADPVTLQISGTAGHASIREGELFFKSERVPGANGETAWTDLPPDWPHPLSMFLDAAVAKAPPQELDAFPLVTAREAAWRSALMEDLYRAAANRSWVECG